MAAVECGHHFGRHGECSVCLRAQLETALRERDEAREIISMCRKYCHAARGYTGDTLPIPRGQSVTLTKEQADKLLDTKGGTEGK